jgi:hypothetical protein
MLKPSGVMAFATPLSGSASFKCDTQGRKEDAILEGFSALLPGNLFTWSGISLVRDVHTRAGRFVKKTTSLSFLRLLLYWPKRSINYT